MLPARAILADRIQQDMATELGVLSGAMRGPADKIPEQIQDVSHVEHVHQAINDRRAPTYLIGWTCKQSALTHSARSNRLLGVILHDSMHDALISVASR